MTDPSESSEPGKARFRLSVVIALAIVIALGALLAWWLKPPEPPAATPAAALLPPSAAPPSTPSPPTPAPERPRRREARPEPPPDSAPTTAPQPPPKPRKLRVTSDVAGAFVFVDRKFVGKTPLETGDITPGSHHLQVSAEGYDGVSRSIEVADAGPTDVMASLKTVVLDARVPVVHKHRFGSCEGALVADLRGLRYDTTNRDDAWTLTFADLETFALDYQGKTLRIKQRGGRTWNFTTRTANADPLLVFQRDVDHARTRLRRTP